MQDEEEKKSREAQNVEEMFSEDNTEMDEIEKLKEGLELARNIAVKEKLKVDELTSVCQRLQADFDNYRKRNNEVCLKMREEIICEVIEKLLPPLDVFDQAFKMIEDPKVCSGVLMIYNQIISAIKSFGIEEIDALNKPFDPNYHNAVMRVDDEANSGLVIDVLQKGYKLGDRIIRHSVVKIAN